MSQTFYPGLDESDPVTTISAATPVLKYPNSTGGFGKRAVEVRVEPSGVERVYGGVSKYYRIYEKKTEYNVTGNGTTYTRTIIEDGEAWDVGWNTYVTDIYGTAPPVETLDTMVPSASDTGWSPSDPAVSFSAPTVAETETSIITTYPVSSSGFTGDKKITQTWSSLILEADLADAAESLIPLDMSALTDLYSWFDNQYIDYSSWSSVEHGEKVYSVVEYRMGTVACKKLIGATVVKLIDIDGVTSETYTKTAFDCTEVYEPPALKRDSSWDSEQPNYRGDNKQLFSEWKRFAALDNGSSANDSVTVTVYLMTYSGHPFTGSSLGGSCDLVTEGPSPTVSSANQFVTPPVS